MNKKQAVNNNENLKNQSALKPVSSPISQGKLVSKVNALTNNSAVNQLLNPQNMIFNNEKSLTLNYKYVIDSLVNISDIANAADFYNKVYSLITQNIDSAFFAIGLFKEKSNCINLKLHDKVGNNFSTKVFLKDEDNPIVQVFKERTTKFVEKKDYLKLSYYKNYSTAILPLISVNKCIGVFIIEDAHANQNIALYSLIANYIALVTHNFELMEKSDEFINTDTLTLLYNHRGFQEILTNEISRAKINKQQLSVMMMDINNITKINRELGHGKGDEVIKLVAEKVRQNVREGDIAGRYGGDELAIILPNTSSEQAKYVAEYLTYSLSCCFIDEIGPIKVSVGVATYPDCTGDKEKLLILAEQAMYISKAKGYKDGMSAIISSSDFNFWDNIALKSYAEVVSKRHSQLGINFEEELIEKFNEDHDISDSRIWEVATSLAGAIDAKDPYTKGHSTSVSKFSEALARAINLPEKEVERITLGALLHDVGKIGIPESVLKKEGPLSDEEWVIMKQHPVIGYEKVLQPNPNLRDLIPIVKYHHERIDGKGYPEGLSNGDIPLAAKIVAIADTYHALISDRPYRKGMNIEKAFEILEEGAGTQWDADLVRTFIQIAPSLGV
ncbi:MAG: diguanylate cyclase [Candidatus Gastranaerophilales bacterium]|nr:diguanylate cyclase [Candidatus Gastranaerophilales bacterium]MCM1072175.1 diguanylate cyclase [Bacteroides sp.]